MRTFFDILRRIWRAPVWLLERFVCLLHRLLDRYIGPGQRERLRVIIFRTDTKEGLLFDGVLFVLIVASVIVVILETVAHFHDRFWWFFFILEWVFTIIFTIEYILRLYVARYPLRYALSFFGLVDLISILPTYLSLFHSGPQHLLIIRILRLMRVFRVFKLGHFVTEGSVVVSALRASRTKIFVFLTFVLLVALVIGAMLYMVEGGTNPAFSSIPKGIYWAIVTLTTVGYGDITPITPLGQFLAAAVMILGYGIIAVPTGIVTAEISSRVMNLREFKYQRCASCGTTEHYRSARYCHHCGHPLSGNDRLAD